jgi:hypothetical protein
VSVVHPEIERIARGIQELHKLWTPHPAQIEVGSALIRGDTKDVFAQCGRNFGKSELVAYLLWRFALTYAGGENYYFAPYMKQAREILWASRRIQAFGPKDWIQEINNTEMRVTFKNGSFIKLDGSDNVDAYRGVKPKGLSVFDEFKDFRPEFYEAYDPNRAAFDSPLMIIGTPPEFEGQFTKLAAAYQSDPAKRFFKFPTSSNPHISRAWLAQKKAELYALGEGDKWEREYQANFVMGGANAIFPMLSKDLIIPHDQMMAKLHRDRKKLEWVLWADPAASSCFAVLFCAINPYSKEIYFVDEIYEQSQAEMTVGKIWPRIRSMRDDIHDGEWRQGYDEAATWFANEVLDMFGEGLEPTQKMKSDKITGLTRLKDLMLKRKLFMSDRCVKFFWELSLYRKDASGKIPKRDDHLIDAARYILDSTFYSVREAPEPVVEEIEQFRRQPLRDEFRDLFEDDLALD